MKRNVFRVATQLRVGHPAFHRAATVLYGGLITVYTTVDAVLIVDGIVAKTNFALIFQQITVFHSRSSWDTPPAVAHSLNS